MSQTTPLYGIPYPTGATKAKDLAAELKAMGEGVEAALAAASIPPVTPAAVMVAPTQTARDAYWGVPGNETQRLALQNRGATTIRTDKGWTERYYATYNAATNPGGATPAGWYPEVDAATLIATAAQNTVAGAAGIALQWSNDTLASGMWESTRNTRITVRRAGVYAVGVTCRVSQANNYAYVRLMKNGSDYSRGENLGYGGAAGIYLNAADTFRAVPGDYFEAKLFSSENNAQTVPGNSVFTAARVGD